MVTHYPSNFPADKTKIRHLASNILKIQIKLRILIYYLIIFIYTHVNLEDINLIQGRAIIIIVVIGNVNRFLINVKHIYVTIPNFLLGSNWNSQLNLTL